MKYTIDQLTGKRFYYNIITVGNGGNGKRIGGLQSVGRMENGKVIGLHPSRLPRKLFNELNPKSLIADKESASRTELLAYIEYLENRIDDSNYDHFTEDVLEDGKKFERKTRNVEEPDYEK